MPELPLVSLITPAFNAAPVIEEALQSVRDQSFRNFEALIVDDGSTDDTAVRVRKVCAADARFHLISQPHAGLPFARNAAVAKTRGEFIAFLDADDVWLPEKLGRQMEVFDQDARANFSYTNFYFWDGARDLSAYYR
ncbi:MAG TPA: glycosyltransferase family A protein, partial [Verrucomicrobiae bacterium]|nr:glycosyltransferase family A protein [Verrucomicrobiae bacterium]